MIGSSADIVGLLSLQLRLGRFDFISNAVLNSRLKWYVHPLVKIDPAGIIGSKTGRIIILLSKYLNIYRVLDK